MAAGRLSLIVFCLFTLSNGRNPCPFEDCKCISTWYDPPNTFAQVTCQLKSKPTFTGNHEYTVRGRLELNGDVQQIPAESFTAFKFIHIVHLIQTSNKTVEADWDEAAFNDTTIEQLRVSNLSGLIPIPAAIKQLGKRGLRGLTISNGDPVALEANFVSELNRLQTLEIQETQISNIDAKAFTGVEHTLQGLTLASASLSKFPRHAVKNLLNLIAFDLSNNNIDDFQAGDFSPYSQLIRLVLSGNSLQQAVQSGALKDLPARVSNLTVENGGIKSVPVDVVTSNPQLTSLSLANNEISSLKDGDFQGAVNLQWLYLSGNPIAEIESGSLKGLNNVDILDLKETKLTSFDLSMCNEMDRVLLELSDNPQLKSVDASKMDMPSHKHGVSGIYLANTGIETLDAKLNDIIHADNFVVFDFKNNTNIICDERIHWMAKHALCVSPLMHIDNTKCANSDTTLRNYLEEHVTDPCKGQVVTPNTH